MFFAVTSQSVVHNIDGPGNPNLGKFYLNQPPFSTAKAKNISGHQSICHLNVSTAFALQTPSQVGAHLLLDVARRKKTLKTNHSQIQVHHFFQKNSQKRGGLFQSGCAECGDQQSLQVTHFGLRFG